MTRLTTTAVLVLGLLAFGSAPASAVRLDSATGGGPAVAAAAGPVETVPAGETSSVDSGASTAGGSSTAGGASAVDSGATPAGGTSTAGGGGGLADSSGAGAPDAGASTDGSAAGTGKDADGSRADGTAADSASNTTGPGTPDPTEVTETPDPLDSVEFRLLTPRLSAEAISDPDQGIRFALDGLKDGDVISTDLGDGPVTVTEDGTFEHTLVVDESAPPGETLGFTVTVEREGAAARTFNAAVHVVAETVSGPASPTAPSGREAVEPDLTVAPERIAGSDFVDEETGVELTVRDCSADAVRFEVWGHGTRTRLYERTVDVEAGTASVRVFGLENRPDAYVGAYDVTAACADTVLEGRFEVTAGAGSSEGGSAAGRSSEDSGDTGEAGSMPRTGVEITGVAAGLILILLGAGAVFFARRQLPAG